MDQRATVVSHGVWLHDRAPLILVRIFSRLPERLDRGFARMLNARTAPFDLINYHGTCWAARIFNRNRMTAKLDRVIDALQRSLSLKPWTGDFVWSLTWLL
jgi:hypothetical protein